MADRLRFGVVVEIGDRFHQLERRDGLDQIFADAALQQVAVKDDVVRMPYHDYLGTRIAAFGQPVELGDDVLARQAAFDDDEVRRWVLLVMRHRRLDPAHVHVDVRLGETAIFRRDLNDLRHSAILAEGLDGNAWDRPRPRAQRLRGELSLFARQRDVELVRLFGTWSGLGMLRHDLSDLGYPAILTGSCPCSPVHRRISSRPWAGR